MDIYLDNAATTQMYPEVVEAMAPFLSEQYGNPGSLHSLGIAAKRAVDNARENVAQFMNCNPEQVVFTSGGSEGNNLVFGGLRPYLTRIGKKHIITSCVEHDSVLKSVEALCIKDQFYSSYLPVSNTGVVNTAYLSDEALKDAGIVSVMYVNNETGAVNPIDNLAKLCNKKGVFFHTDCVQAAGFQELDVERIGCDFMTISSHKIHGPKGMGALFVRDYSCLSPIIYGGAEQEHGYRGGTENVAGIVGFGEACKIASKERAASIASIMEMKKVFYNTLCSALVDASGNAGITINGMGVSCPSKILNIMFDTIDGQTLVLFLSPMRVCISAGSACRNSETAPSHVLTMMGLTEQEARSSVRISFSSFNTIDEVTQAALIIAGCVSSLRGSSI